MKKEELVTEEPSETPSESLTERLVELLGNKFLCFVLGLDDPASLTRVLLQPTDVQAAILRQLAPLTTYEFMERHPFARQIDLANLLGIVRPGSSQNPANQLRELAGAGLPSLPETKDPVEAELLVLLQALYPLFLLPVREHDPFAPHTGGAAHNHPNRGSLEKVIRQDPALGKLFPQQNESTGWSGQLLRSTGQGGDIQLWGFAEQQLRVAWQTASLDMTTPDSRSVAANLRKQLAKIRRAVLGKQASVHARVGLTGGPAPAWEARARSRMGAPTAGDRP